MLAELGVPIVVLITALMFRQIVVRSGFRTEGVALFLFVLGLLAIDQWHDDPWFGTLLLLTLVQMHTSRGTREAGLPLAR